MRIPKDDKARLDLYQEAIYACRASRERRLEQYANNRRWYLYGNNDGSRSPWNKIYSHLDLVTSFLYASDSTRFSVELGDAPNPADHRRTGSTAKRITRKWKKSNADIICQQAILWALIYDSAFVKLIRRKGNIEPFVVDPGSFGVYREDTIMLDRQEAFVHWYYMTETDFKSRLRFHPNRDQIIKLVTASQQKQDVASSMPPIIDRVIMNSVTPNLVGEANINLDSPPEYRSDLTVPLIEMSELYIWNDDEDDYQIVTMASDDAVVYDRQNFFFPRTKEFEAEHPFIQFCPNPMYDYFWGEAEIDNLIPLQQKLNDAHDDIEKLYKKQVDPPTAWEGMGLTEEKLFAYNLPKSQIALGDQAKPHSYVPTLPPEAFKRIEKIEQQFEEMSSITNVLAGRGEAGVRSAGHAGKLASLGSSRPKKRALIIEDSLEKAATLYGRLTYVDDDHMLLDEGGQKFIVAQMGPDFEVKIDAHSNSPVFMESQKEDAALLFKAKAIDRKRLIQMVGPPMQEDLIRDLEEKIIPAEKAAAAAKQQAEQAAAQAKAAGGKLKVA